MKMPLWDSLWPRRQKVVVWTVAVCLFYTVFGFLILPLIVRGVVVKQLSKHLDRRVTLHKVRINPYSLNATIRGLLIEDKDGEALVSWDEVRVNFQIASLFSKAWIFKDVSLSQPFVRVQINKDYTLNFSDILAKFSKRGDPGKSSAVKINRLRFIGAKASFTDLTPRMPFHRIIGPFEVTLVNFRSDSDSKNQYAFSGITDGGEQFSWKGFFYLDPLRSEGEFSVDGVSLINYAPLYQDVVRFEIKDGVINLHATYQYERSAATNLLSVTNTAFALKSLKVAEKGTNENVIEVSSFVVSGASVDAMARTAEADAVTVSDGRVVFRRNKDTSINAIELAKPAESASNIPGGIILLLRAMTNVVSMLLNTTNLSTGIIRDLNVTNCALHLEDRVNPQPVRLDLEGIAVNAKNISNRSGTNLTAEVSMRWDTNGTVRADIAGLSPASAQIELALNQLDLRPLAPYLEPHLDILVLGSKLGLAGTIHLRHTTNELPEVGFKGDAWLDDFSTAGRIESESLLKWNDLRISGIEANLNPPVVSATEVRVADAFVRLIIETNRTINLMSALRWGGTNAPSPLRVTNTTPTNVIAVAVRPKISIGSVVVSNANVHFIDRSLQPNVNILIEQLSGAVAGLSSDDSERAVVHLRGTVDKTALADIDGKINPWNQKQPIELKLVVKNMDLLPEDPYSAKYLGYQLKKGKLSLELSHQLSERKLKSQNRITLDHLTLGEKVASPDATTLPVRLAIAVLKDRNGRIELEVPIEGSLDDPKFHMGQVIARTIANVFNKIVTSPFAALKAIFGGKGEELSFQEFEPGSTNLLPATIEKLNALVKGLYERPELQLEIEGSTDAETDVDALRAEKLRKQFRLRKWELLLPAEQARLSPDEVKLAPDEYAAFLSEAYAQAFRPEAIAERTNQRHLANKVANAFIMEPKSAATNSQTAHTQGKHFSFEKGATALMRKPTPLGSSTQLDMNGSLMQTEEITLADLQTLAMERSRNVKAYLLQTGKVEAERISVTELNPSTTSKGSRVYLRLQ